MANWHLFSVQGLRAFGRDPRGSVALMFGLMFPLLILLAGGATDISRAHAVKTKAQRTLDSTVLSMARSGLENDKIEEIGEDQFRTSIAIRDIPAALESATFTAEKNGTPGGEDLVVGEATLVSTNFFLGILGKNDLTITVTSQALKPNPLPYEIALVLDVSGSMENDLNGATRLQRLQESTRALFETLDATTSAQNAPSISVIPYSTSVNIGSVNSNILSATSVRGTPPPALGGDVWAAERSRGASANGFNITDNNPASDPIPFVNTAEMPDASPVHRILPLTNNRAQYLNAINGLTARGATAGHLGMIWGVYSLSPSWNSVWAQAPKPNGSAQKIIVMLTDGEFNTTHNIGAQNTEDTQTSNAYFQSACSLAKDRGIVIYTIALSVDATSEQLLAQCADGSGGQMFSANSANSLENAFRSIAQAIGGLRLSS